MSRILNAILYRKKKYSIMGVMLFLLVLLMLVISVLLDTSKNEILRYYENRYGRFHMAVHQVNRSTADKLLQNIGLKTGLFESYGLYRTEEDSGVTLGSYDDTAIELACFQMLDGAWPEDDTEIVIDESTSKFGFKDVVSVGDTITLYSPESDSRSYMVSGIIEDFRGEWNDPEVIIVPGFNDYPNAILKGNNDLAITDKGIMMYSIKDGIDGQGVWACNSIYYTIVDVPDFKLEANNNNLYFYAREQVFGQFLSFQRAITIIIYLSSVSIFYILIKNILDDYEGSIRKYQFLGTSGWYIQKQINTEFLIVYVFSVSLPVLINFFVGNAGVLYYCLFSVIIFVLITNLMIRIRIIKAGKKEEKQHKDIVSPKKSLVKMIYSIFVRANLRKILSSLMILASILSCFFVSSFHMQDIRELFEVNDQDFIYNVAGYFNTIKGLAYAERQFTGAPYELAADLLSLDGIDSFSLFLQGTLGWPVYKEPSLYWQLLTIEDHSDMDHSRDLIGYDDYIYGVTYADIIIIDDYNQDFILRYFPEMPLEEMSRNGSIALALPVLHYGSDTITDDLYHEGDMFPIGNLTTHDEEPADIFYITGKDLKYTETDLKIERIFQYEFDIPEMKLKNNNALVLMTADTLKELDRDLLCVDLEVHLKDDITAEQYVSIEKAFYKMRTSSSNSYYYCKRDAIKDMTKLITTINYSLLLLMIVLGMFSVIAIYMLMYMNILKHSRLMGITMSQGLTARKISASIYLESLTYTGMMVLISIVITFYAFHKIWIINNLNQPRFFPVLILMGTVYLFVLIVIPVFLSLVFRRRIHRTEISDFIRYRE